MVFQLDFKDLCHNIMCLEKALIVRDRYGLFLHSDHFSV